MQSCEPIRRRAHVFCPNIDVRVTPATSALDAYSLVAPKHQRFVHGWSRLSIRTSNASPPGFDPNRWRARSSPSFTDNLSAAYTARTDQRKLKRAVLSASVLNSSITQLLAGRARYR